MFGVKGMFADARRQAMNALGRETVVHEGPANFLLRWEGVGGWLVLSHHWLVFASHSVNWRRGRLLVPVERIQEAMPQWARLLGLPLVPTILAVRTKGGREYQFVVRDRHYWAKVIHSLCG